VTAHALVVGKVVGEIITRPTKGADDVTFVRLRVVAGGAAQFWSLAIFSDALREIVADLPEGAVLAASGEIGPPDVYEWNGEVRVTLRMTVDGVTPLQTLAGLRRLKRDARRARRQRRARNDAPTVPPVRAVGETA
jgi:hypothetical protein